MASTIALVAAVLLLAPALMQPERARQVSSPQDSAVMTEELMARLITRTLASKKATVLNDRIAGFLGLNDGGADIPARQVSASGSNVRRVFNVPLTPDCKHAVFMVRTDKEIYVYLTDRSALLRDAAVLDANGLRRLSTQEAHTGYQAELALFAQEAASLPPSDGHRSGCS